MDTFVKGCLKMLVACHGDINHVNTQNFFDPETSV